MASADMEKHPDEVSGMFDDVARHYDRTNDVLSAGQSILWRVATTKAVAPVAGERILDVAAGTGTSSAALARSGATVVAVDFSPGMIAEGRKRHPRIEFIEADATRLPFGDDEFDAATISFGLRNVHDPRAALAEMYRVLKPGGRIVVCEFSRPPRAIVRAGYYGYLNAVMPVVAKVSSSNADAYDYLAESIRAWPDQGELSRWLRAVGFTRVAYRNLSAGVVALHRGRKPADAAVLASVEKRRTRRSAAAPEPPAPQ
ncbi:bifunctional demethylmenaquinone methyltransferase/2-methoxy-6-polyprenyl-1,4-benzoquinol methylase UbiE [Galbitalea sp. SE-J8]|uniref:bifunctional demethylmenaquinone methyltransferase/2-methoxy-6-polyprenyl-1,4-benzoquinol methylase UbiE n=1 Tax=Galbitalea sp. SE-J8 TaxID=3054952 RepID=UPI00259CB8F8|nr:bifunctional demethylmenaquinone methyltransferase/2-methoxy-6-polyprenyl-1,4-benzoquinol methylase UbiE [Galbitalea sp. SE-J8]MDM4762410.1 bifunctional demethylmenaquinone methyltransferase/2-methoxy-6-polyprenyl-1,4-benzoquinol methylase UbiE [Galbitalea sp. SE-J8]